LTLAEARRGVEGNGRLRGIPEFKSHRHRHSLDALPQEPEPDTGLLPFVQQINGADGTIEPAVGAATDR
jgi:hypothetical protein